MPAAGGGRDYSRAMTNAESPSAPRRPGFRTGRLEAFSDGVFAIAVYYITPFRNLSAGFYPRRRRKPPLTH